MTDGIRGSILDNNNQLQKTSDNNERTEKNADSRLLDEAQAPGDKKDKNQESIKEMRGADKKLPQEFPSGESLIIDDGRKQTKVPGDADPDLKTAGLKRIADKCFPYLDRDNNGFISKEEIDAALKNSFFHGEDAQFLTVLRKHLDEIQNLSKDETLYEGKGASRNDFKKLEKIAQKPMSSRTESEKKLCQAIDEELSRSGNALATASHDLFADKKNPLASITPDGVKQGKIGDCYFLAPLASLAATNPQAIRDMIKDNHNNTYTVTFPGDPKHPVTVSAPTDSEMCNFAQASQHGMWAPLMEKAYGTYLKETSLIKDNSATPAAQQADGGSLFEAGMKILSPDGYVSNMLNFSFNSTIDERLKSAFAEHRPVVLSTFGLPLVMENNTTDGLARQHEYSVVAYDPATKTLTIRNPWGHGGPNRPQDKNAPDNGTFKMTLDEVNSNFTRIAYGQGKIEPKKP